MMRRSTPAPSVIGLAVAIAMLMPCTLDSQSICRAGEHPNGEEPKPAPDLTTPRSAVLAWTDAFWNGDTRTVHQILVDNEEQREIMAGSLRFCAALRLLESAAIKQFGEPGRRVTGYPDGSAKAVEKQLKIEEDGEWATASMKDAMLPLRLRRIEGRWRVDLSEFARSPQVRRISEASDRTAAVAEGVAKEIAAGKFETGAAREVSEAVRRATRESRRSQW